MELNLAWPDLEESGPACPTRVRALGFAGAACSLGASCDLPCEINITDGDRNAGSIELAWDQSGRLLRWMALEGLTLRQSHYTWSPRGAQLHRSSQESEIATVGPVARIDINAPAKLSEYMTLRHAGLNRYRVTGTDMDGTETIQFDPHGRFTGRRIGNDTIAAVRYDPRGRGASTNVDLQYDDAGRLVHAVGAKFRMRLEYDPRGWPKELRRTINQPGNSDCSDGRGTDCNPDDVPLAQTYQYDDSGRLSQVTTTHGTTVRTWSMRYQCGTVPTNN